MLVGKLTLCAGAGFLWALAVPFNTTWTAKLSPVGGSTVTGTATVDVGESPSGPGVAAPTMQKPDTTKVPSDASQAGNPGGESWAAISISGAQPGEYPWKIGPGGCGTEASSIPSEKAFPPIKVGSDGRGTTRSKVDFQLKPGGEFSVSVLKSRSDRAVIACGKLEPSGQMPAPTARDTTAPKP